MTMSEGKKGDIFSIKEIQTDIKTKKRLQDLGLTKDIEVKILSLYAKNAYILNVRGSRMVLGKDIARHIVVDPSPCNSCEKIEQRNMA